MKNKNKILTAFILLIATICICLMPSINLFAESTEIQSSSFADQNLYTYLYELKGGPLFKDSFINGIPKNKGDTKLTQTLDLSISTTKVKFSSIKGLDQFEFRTLTTLSLQGQQLSSLNNAIVSHRMPNLTSLNLSQNKLETIDLTLFDSLQVLNLNSNNFTTLNNVKLSLNKPTVASEEIVRKVHICNNKLNMEETDSIISQNQVNEYTLGVQGIRDGEALYGNSTIWYARPNFMPNTSIEIFSFNEDNSPASVAVLDGVENKVANLTYGKYLITFSQQDNNGNVPPEFPLSQIDFVIKVENPVISYFQNGEQVDSKYKVDSPITITFTPLENGELHLFMDNVELDTNTVEINKFGNYKITFYQVVNGVESDHLNVYISCTMNVGSQFLYIFLVAFAFVALFGGVIFLYLNPFWRKNKMQNGKREKF